MLHTYKVRGIECRSLLNCARVLVCCHMKNFRPLFAVHSILFHYTEVNGYL